MATPQPSTTPPTGDPVREAAIAQYRKKFLEHREMEAKVKKSPPTSTHAAPSPSSMSAFLYPAPVLSLCPACPPLLS